MRIGTRMVKSKSRGEFVAPRALDVQQFAVARAAEVQSLYSSLKDRSNSAILATPRHLRRRTNSHNRRKSFYWTLKQKRKPEAAPGDGAEADQGQDDGGGLEAQKAAKPPSRKVRRRMELRGVARGEGGKTSDGTKRLVTHVWHAKRFKMKKMWGHLLAEGLNGRGKGSRAVIGWSKKSAILHDASYYTPIELEGPAGGILDVLSVVLDPSPSKLDVLSESEVAEITGASYGNAVLHHAGRFPFQTIAPVTYMWQPMPTVVGELTEVASKSNKENKTLSPEHVRHLWIWIHAAGVEEALESLQTACKSQGGVVCCRSRSGEFGRLDLLGAGANEVLRKVLLPYYRRPYPAEIFDQNSSEQSVLEARAICHSITEHNKSLVAICSKLFSFVERLPDRAVVAMDVRDPRDPPFKLTRLAPTQSAVVEVPPADISLSENPNEVKVEDPPLSLAKVAEHVSPGQDKSDLGAQDTKELGAPVERCAIDIPRQVEKFAAGACSGVTDEENINDVMTLWWELLENSAIWNETSGCRHPFTEQALSSKRHRHRLSVYNADRSLLPGKSAPWSRHPLVCPLLLLKHDGQKPSTSRWSLIMPISWIQAFWVPLVFAGGHVIGMRELRWLMTDAGLPSYPFDYPDCGAYTSYVNEKSSSLLEYNKKRPPVNRVVPLVSPWRLGTASPQHATSDENKSLYGAPVVEAKDCPMKNPSPSSSFKLDETDDELPQAKAVEADLEAGSHNQTGSNGMPSFAGAGHGGSMSFQSSQAVPNSVLGNVDAVDVVSSSQQVDGGEGRSSEFSPSTSSADAAICPATLRENGTTHSFCVARTRTLIEQVSAAENLSHEAFWPKERGTLGATGVSALMQGSTTYVRVNIQAPRKGSIEEGAVVFLPSASDTDAWFNTCDRWQGHYVVDDECNKRQGQGKKRKKREMKADGNRESKKRKVEHKTAETPCNLVVDSVTTASAAPEVMDLAAESRERVGFVTSAGVRGSFPEMAVAFCELVKLGTWRAAQLADSRWKDTTDIFLLVRNPLSTVYRPAMATIVL